MLKLILILNNYTGTPISHVFALSCHLLYLFVLDILTECVVKSRITTDKPDSVVEKHDESLH